MRYKQLFLAICLLLLFDGSARQKIDADLVRLAAQIQLLENDTSSTKVQSPDSPELESFITTPMVRFILSFIAMFSNWVFLMMRLLSTKSYYWWKLMFAACCDDSFRNLYSILIVDVQQWWSI